jgi:hypothetical protein
MAIPTVSYDIQKTHLSASWQVAARILSVTGLPDKGLFVFRRDPFSGVYTYSHVASYDDMLFTDFNHEGDDWNRVDRATLLKDTEAGANTLIATMEKYIQALIDEKRRVDYEETLP